MTRVASSSFAPVGGLLVLAAAAYWPLVSGLPESGAGGLSPALIIALFAWLAARRRSALRESLARARGVAPALPLLAAGLGLGLWSHHTGAVDLMIPSLVGVLLGGAWLLGGAAGLRALALPTLFLLFAFPVPGVLRNLWMAPLQRATAGLAAWMLGVIGHAPLRIGALLVVDGEPFEVIEACSGIASIEALTVAAVIFADLSYRNRIQAWVIVLSAPLLAFLMNGVRVLTIIGDPDFDPEAGHALPGLVMILVGAFLLTRIDALLARVQRPRPSDSRRSDAPDAPPRRAGLARWIALGALLAALASAPLWVPAHRAKPLSEPSLAAQVPMRSGRWRGVDLELDDRFLGSVRATDHVYRRYRRARGVSVRAFVARDDRRDRRASLVSTKTEQPGFGWRVVERRPLAHAAPGERAEWLLLRSPHGERLVLHRRRGVATLAEEIARALLALDQSFLRRPRPVRVERLDTPVLPRPGGRERAEKRVRSLAARLGLISVDD